jgi:exopolysaccharide biosynthesis WecB/TagA/CpsF family protein
MMASQQEFIMTRPAALNLFNFNIINDTAKNTLEAIFDGTRQTVAFLNAHCINVAAKNTTYRWALTRATTLLPDGSGLQLAARMNGSKFVENLNGTDLFPLIMQKAADCGHKVFLFGSLPGVAEKAALTAQAHVPGLEIAGTRHGFFTPEEESDIINSINASGADVVLVALGVPLQDVWIARNRHRLNARITFGVGAQFDFWAGRVSRAPAFLRRLGMEWIWRLAVEPRRMFKRYILGNPAFVLRSLKAKLSQAFQISWDNAVRRVLDLVLSGGALFALAPVIGLIGLAIKLESSGPVFFTQTRLGKNGVPFKIYKFRSMFADAEDRRAALLHTSQRKGVCFKNRNDPRVTRVGRFLRRFSLDELPQILNVFKGQMAIVGPRPALPQEVSAYPAKALGRLAVKPGLTGLWQVSGRAEVSFERMINMDLAYAKSRTVFSDIALIALTFRAVLTGRGAY